MISGITACSADLSIQALSYCAKNPSQKLHPDEAKVIRNQRAASVVSKLTHETFPANNEDFQEVFESPKSQFSCFTSCFHMPSILSLKALIFKNLMKILRNYMGLIFLLVLPIVEVTFFCIAIGQNPKHLPIGIVNFEAKFGQNCTFEEGCDFNDLACRLSGQYDKMETFDIQYYDSEDKAFDAAKANEIWGYIAMHRNYSEALFSRFWSQSEADESTRNQSTTQVSLFLIRSYILLFLM